MLNRSILKLKGIEKNYQGIPALMGVDLDVEQGEIVVIMGPSGCGKSTLLKCINVLVEPDNGDIIFDNISLRELCENDLRKLRQKIGFVFQNHNLIARMNVLQNVALGLIAAGTSYSEAANRSLHALKQVGLDSKVHAYPNNLSGGEKQRVAIARALVMNPELILWDEPTSSLDAALVEKTLKLIKDLSRKNQTSMIIVTHELSFAQKVADRLIIMEKGKIIHDKCDYIYSQIQVPG